MKNTLPHIASYENTIFGKKDNLKRDMTSFNLKKALEYLKSIIYVKEYFCMFSSTLKDITQAQNKTNH